MTNQLEAIREIEETNRRKPLAVVLADIKSGKNFSDLRKQFNAAGVTAEAYTVNELCNFDIYVDGDLVAYKVTEVFPEVSRRQVFEWLLKHAEKHHEICGTL